MMIKLALGYWQRELLVDMAHGLKVRRAHQLVPLALHHPLVPVLPLAHLPPLFLVAVALERREREAPPRPEWVMGSRGNTCL